MNLPFQIDQPLFVKRPFRAGNRSFKTKALFPWKELSFEEDKVITLYNSGFVYHNDDLVIERKVGDGLDELSVEELSAIVNNINNKVKKYSSSLKEFQTKKCKKSKIKSKQMGLIRSWRRQYGDIENTG